MFVSCNLPQGDDNLIREVEKRIIEEISVEKEKFV